MKYTLLELTQLIASSLGSDEINSISDSVEAQDIAKIVRTAYYDIVTRLQLPEHHTLFNLDASGDSTKPTLMTLPSTVASILELKYNKETASDTDQRYEKVHQLDKKSFFDLIHSYEESADNVGSFTHTISGSSIHFMYKDDAAPTYFTTFDDNTIIFDSYDSNVDSTLQAAKTWCWGRKVIEFTLTNSFVPTLDEPQFALLLNEAKALAWAEMKQTTHQKAEQNARRHWVHTQNSKTAVDAASYYDRLPNYGRK